jgi:DegV family protein with EDD domain
MGRIRIVTDSTADLPSELVARYDITVVPLKIIFSDDEVYRDGIDLTLDRFYARLAELPASTSQPSPAEFLEVYKPWAEQGDQIISIHISSALSGTVHSAQAARSLLPDASIAVIDSKGASIPLGLAVLAAARAARAGRTQEEVLEVVDTVLATTRTYFMVDTLEYLQRGGRIGKAQAFLGTLLNIKPILTLNDGLVCPFEKVRGRAKGLDRLATLLAEAVGDRRLVYGIVHGNAPGLFAQLKTKLTARVGFGPSLVSRVGGVVGTHVGPGVVGFTCHAAVGEE